MDSKEKIFDELFHDYYQSMFKYCLTIVLNERIADEIVHEAYVRLWSIWDERVSYPQKLNKGWLIRAVEYIIKETNRQRTADDINEIAELVGHDNEMTAKNEQLQYEYYIKKIREYLKPRDRQLFDYLVMEELTYSEIADRLKIKEVSVRSRIVRMRKRLAPYIKKILSKNNMQ